MLAEFDIKLVATKSVKVMVVAEYLSDLAVEFEKEKNFSFPNE